MGNCKIPERGQGVFRPATVKGVKPIVLEASVAKVQGLQVLFVHIIRSR